MRIFKLLLLLVVFVQSQNAPFDEKKFFETLQTSYYNLKDTELKNFLVLVQNQTTQNMARYYWKNADIFPLQLIWLNPDHVFLSEQGVPALPDSAARQYSATVEDLKRQVSGLLFDLKRFYLAGIFETISNNYQIELQDRVVRVSYDMINQNDTTRNVYYFGLNGLLLKTESFSPDGHRKVTTTPHFKIIKTKWICTGWEAQMWLDENVESGFVINLDMREYQNIWIPYNIDIVVQQSRFKGRTFTDRLLFRNYIYDQSLQMIKGQ